MNQVIDHGTIRADLEALERTYSLLSATDDAVFVIRLDLLIARLRALLAA